MSLQRPLSAGQTAEFECVSSGAKPPAKLSWSKNGRPISAATSSGALTYPVRQFFDQSQANASHSVLTMHLDSSDHNAQLTCRAESGDKDPAAKAGEILPDGMAAYGEKRQDDDAIEETIELTVQCKFALDVCSSGAISPATNRLQYFNRCSQSETRARQQHAQRDRSRGRRHLFCLPGRCCTCRARHSVAP